MFIKKLIMGIVLASMSVAAQANLIFDVSNSIKFNDLTFLSIDRRSLTGEGQMTFSEGSDAVKYHALLSNNWTLNFSLLKSNNFGSYNPRCPIGTTCDTSSWYFLGLDPTAESTVTRENGRKYVITDAWGQFGINAGGKNVTPNGGLASGLWLKNWTEYKANGVFARNGKGGDINGYASQVPEPTSLALLGIGIFGMAVARRRAK